jgi:crotonobetainyl-CoA:carnitine CoA-transferase CaiB-like acyl-CoA transferase
MITHQPVNNHDDIQKVVDGILDEIGLSRGDLDGKVTFAGLDPIMPTTLKVGAAGGILGAVNSFAAAIIWQMRSGEGQDIHADLRKTYAIQSAYNPGMEKYSMINGYSVLFDQDTAAFSGILPSKDSRFVFLCALYPRQRYTALNLLRCGNSMDALKQAARKWDAEDLEAAAMDAMVPIHNIRTQKEFQATEQWEHHAATPLIHIEKIGDSDPEPFTPAARPLSGIRATGFWHVIAGPTIARQLAAQGADCMNLCKPQWHADKMMYFTAEAGTRQAMLDASKPENKNKVYELVKDADVFIENLRPGLADSEGYSAEELAVYRPGLIYVQDKLNVGTGPWSGWPGFDMNAGAIAGIFTDSDGTPSAPANPSTWVVNDFLTGYLGAIGAQAALIRRAKEGGSYRVRVTLAQCATFMLSMGLIDKNVLLDLKSLGEEHQAMEPKTQTGQTPFGKLTRLGSQIEMSKTPEYWEDPILYVMGSCMPEWLPR